MDGCGGKRDDPQSEDGLDLAEEMEKRGEK